MALTQPQRDLLEELESMSRSELTEDNKRLLLGLQQKREQARHNPGARGESLSSLRSVIEVGEGRRGNSGADAQPVLEADRRCCPSCQSEEIRTSSLIDFVLHECGSCRHSWKTPAVSHVADPVQGGRTGWPQAKFVASPKRFRSKEKMRRTDDY